MNVRSSDRRRAYALDRIDLLAVAGSAFLFGLLFVAWVHPLQETVIGRALPGQSERLWALAFCGGGGMILLGGFWRLDARWEVAGLFLLAGAISTYGYTIFAERGFGPGVVSATVFGALAAGYIARALVLYFEPTVTPWRDRGDGPGR